MPRLSIIIPFLGDVKPLEETLVSVLENRPDDAQIIVVLNRPYDDPYDVKDEVLFVEAPQGFSFTACVNLGIAASRAPIVHLLLCGVEVTAGWADAAMTHFADPQVAAVAPLILRRGRPKRVLAAGLAYRPSGSLRRLSRASATMLGPDILAGLYRKTALERVGRFRDEWSGSLAAADLAIRLTEAGFRCVLEPECRTVAEATTGVVHGTFRQGRDAEQFFWRRRAAHGIGSLVDHAFLVAGDCLQIPVRPSKVLYLAGRLAGLLSPSPAPQPAAPAPALEHPVIGRPHFNTIPHGQKQPVTRSASESRWAASVTRR